MSNSCACSTSFPVGLFFVITCCLVITHINQLFCIGIADWTENEVPNFAKVFVTKDNNGDPVSYALGINMWSLLLLVSMGATTLHPHVVSDLSRSIIKEILDRAPMCVTPGNSSLVRSFHILTTTPQRIVTNNNDRPGHFPRPMGDLSFATTGAFTYAKNVDKYMPEDVMHCGFLFGLMKTFSCTIFEIPGNAVYSDYEIIAGVKYAVWNCVAQKEGCLEVGCSLVVVLFYLMPLICFVYTTGHNRQNSEAHCVQRRGTR
jgi:hypothetical protein